MSGVGHGHGDHGSPENRRVALMIAVLALVLAFAETLGKSAQTAALNQNVEASNLWSFFQAKTIRQTVMRTAAEEAQAEHGDAAPEALKKQVAKWKDTADRYQSEPETGEGRKELAARAKKAEEKRKAEAEANAPAQVAESTLKALAPATSDTASLLRDVPGVSLQGAGGVSSLPRSRRVSP